MTLPERLRSLADKANATDIHGAYWLVEREDLANALREAAEALTEYESHVQTARDAELEEIRRREIAEQERDALRAENDKLQANLKWTETELRLEKEAHCETLDEDFVVRAENARLRETLAEIAGLQTVGKSPLFSEVIERAREALKAEGGAGE